MDKFINNIKSSLSNNIISTETFIHPEEYGNDKLNLAINNANNDLINIDKEIKDLAIKTNDCLINTTKRLDNVLEIIKAEQERLQDILMLCNKNTDYVNAIPLSDADFNGQYGHKNSVFYSYPSNSTPINSTIESIIGNGYEGNKYVLSDNGYLEETLDTSSRDKIIDNSISSYWEYSRIIASSSEQYLISDFNTDDAEAKCTITFKFNSYVNEIEFNSNLDNVKITEVRYSSDGINYKDLAIMPFIMNNKQESYENEGYIYGSNIISFPNSKYLKVTFESIGYLNETIAFNRSEITTNDKINEITTIVPTAKRHVIRINDFAAYSKRFIGQTTFKSRQLINEDNDIYAISIFANIYYPNSLSQDYLKFILNINGKDYEIIPVNINNNGKKIIRFSQGKLQTEYTEYIGEKIKSAYLTIVMKSDGVLTPYVNNIKVLLGDEI